MDDFDKRRRAAADALVAWAKAGMGEFNMRDSVINCLESCGANPSIDRLHICFELPLQQLPVGKI